MKKTITRFITSSFIVVLTLFMNSELRASHIMGADMSYVCLDPLTNTYMVTLNLYRDCSGINAPATAILNVTSASCGQAFTETMAQTPCPSPNPNGGTDCEVSPLCDLFIGQSSCNGGTLPGVEQYTYTATVVLPDSCTDWVFSWSSCCRNPLITTILNPAAEGLYIEAGLDNTIDCNNSPSFTTLPVPFICANQLFNYNHGAIDVDGDSLVYTLITPLTTGPGMMVTHVPGLSATYPLTTTTLTFPFDTTTGQMSFTPDGTQVAIVAILVEEYRNGVLIGSTMRDIQVVVLNIPGCNNPGPVFNGIDTTTLVGGVIVNDAIEVCPGSFLTFDVLGTGTSAGTSDSCVKMTSNVALSIPTAMFDTTRISCDSIIGTFTWTPSAADIGTHNLIVIVSGNSCPLTNSQAFNITIEVLDGTFAGPDKIYCPAGGPQQIAVGGGSMFMWEPTGPGSGIVATDGPDSNWIMVAPAQTTDYIVTSNLSSTCKNKDTVNIKVVPDFIFSTNTSKDTICLFDSVQLSTITDPVWAPYTFTWTPGGSLSNANIANPLASPPATVNYVVTVVSDTGCLLKDTVPVVVSGIAPQFVEFDGNPVLCSGDSNLISAVTCLTFFEDDFDPDTDNPLWAVNTGDASTACGSVSGNALYFNDANNRGAQTFDMNVSGGGIIEFYLKIANTFAAGCEVADAGEDVYLEYSLNGNAGPWVNIQTFLTGPTYANFTFLSIQIPAAAQSPTTRFRWIQTNFSGAGFDNWALDEVSIQLGCCDATSCGPYDYQWTPTTGISDSTIQSPWFFPTVTTMYYVTVTVPGTDCSRSDSLLVSVVPGFNYTLSATEDTICANSSSIISIVADSSGMPYNFDWDPKSSIAGPDTTAVIEVRPQETTTYSVVILSNEGCRVEDSIQIVVQGRGPKVFIAADKNNICPGDTVQFSTLVSTLECGLNPTPSNPCPLNSNFVVADIGTATTTQNVATPYNGFYEDGRVLILYQAGEMIAKGMGPGTITDVGFNVSAIAGTLPYTNFTIKMGCTNLNNFDTQNTFIDNLDIVVNPFTYTTNLGWNNHNLDNPYDWDGTTNLLVEICFDNTAWTDEDDVFYTNTSYESVLWDEADGQIGCDLTQAATSTQRPNVRFVMCTYSPPNIAYQWIPSTGLSCDTCANPYAVVYEDITYTLFADDGLCAGDTSHTINIDSSFYITALNDTAICDNDSVPLHVVILGNPPPAISGCGLNPTPCFGSPTYLNADVGTGTNSSGTNPQAHTPFGGFFEDGRMQMLFRASELIAPPVNLTTGTITDIGFNIAQVLSTDPYSGFTIKMGCTSNQTLTSFIPNLNVVYTPSSYTPIPGWNNFNLNTAYDWDGVQNLVVEVCFDNSAWSDDDDVFFTATGWNSVVWQGQDFATGCSLTPGNPFDERPNMRIVMCQAEDAPILYSWTPSSTLSDTTSDTVKAFPSVPTTYTVEATFVNGCVLRDSVLVDIGGFAYSVLPAIPDTICPGDTAILQVLGGDFYEWIETDSTMSDTSISNPFVFPLGTRWYVVNITDSAGCRIRDSVLVAVRVPPPFGIGGNQVICDGQSVTLDPGPGFLSYEWSPNGEITQTINVSTTGCYSVVIYDGFCYYPSNQACITIPQAPTIGPDVTICQGDSTVLSAPPGYVTYSWGITGDMTNTTVATVTGSYDVTVTDVYGCTLVSNALQVDVIAQPNASLGPDFSICPNEVTTIGPVATPGASYMWSNNESTQMIDVSSAGVYSVTVSVGSCTSTGLVVVSEYAEPVIDLGPDIDSCCGASVVLNPNSSDNLSWSTGSSNSSITVNATGVYSVTATDGNNCTNTDEVAVNIRCIIDTLFANPSAILQEEQSQLSVISFYNGDFTVDWIPNDTVVNFDSMSTLTNPLFNSQTFTLVITDNQTGCSETDTVTVSVIPPSPFAMPNAFTPNVDGLNDVFRPLVQGITTVEEFRIYNRWGDKLYDYADGVALGWDGTYSGKLQPVGTYVYYVVFKTPDPQIVGEFSEVKRQGNFSLIR